MTMFQQPLLLLPILLGIVSTKLTFAANVRANVVDLFSSDRKECRDCHRFDGIGGLSGGGGTSRLLLQYPEDVQAEILDFLFLPNFGASLHILKVEIGGDAQSTDGSESSHMHSRDDLNWNRGYEWWLLKEAKKRNPDIITYGLPWAWPGWITSNNQNPFQHLDLATNYTIQWVKGAKEQHGIDIDYLGIWNEIGTSREYLLALRKALDANGFHKTKIVSNDGSPQDLFPHLVNDTGYINAIDVLGFHYPNDRQGEIWKLANSFHKPIWSSEESSSYDDLNGASCWVRAIASHYVLNNMTANIMWNLLGSYFHGTNWYASSMITAVQPWTGYYEWERMPVIWATAHYTQFLQPGFLFLPVGQGSGELSAGGYYVTLVSPDLRYFTLIVVKISRDHASCTRPTLWNWDTQNELFHISIDLPALLESDHPEQTTGIQTWYSNFEQANTVLFEKVDPRDNNVSSVSYKTTPDGRHSLNISLNVTIGSIFTITNQVHIGNKGEVKMRRKPDSFFPLPYYDDFNNYDCDNCYSRYLSDQMGAFEIQFVDTAYNSKWGSKNVSSLTEQRALVQMTPALPVTWGGEQRDRGPVTVMGMTEWEDIRIKSSFLTPDLATAACVSTRTDQLWKRGITFCANSSHWFLAYGGANLTGYDPSSADGIAYGHRVTTHGEWHTMSLLTLGNKAEGYIDDDLVIGTLIRTGDSGFASLGVSTYAPVQFGHIDIQPIGSHWSKPHPSPVASSKEPSGWSLSLLPCTPNGFSQDSEQFDLTANWQILHLQSGLCVTTVSDRFLGNESFASLTLQECRHDYVPQQFRHEYTLIRNGGQWPLSNALGDLCGTRDGKISLTTPPTSGSPTLCVGASDSFFARWALYPNTHQLRNAFGYRPWMGDRAMCLQARSAEATIDHVEGLIGVQ